MSVSDPSALIQLMREFLAAEPDGRNSGISAQKTGYHNSRANHVNDVEGGNPGDYSIRLPIDKQGPSDKAAAIDISFDSARLRSDFDTIAKYSRRLLDACALRDSRLFDGDRSVIREWFGNIDTDREVEGWTFHRTSDGSSGPASSDNSHLWHIHISFHRAYVENWDAVSGVLDVLLGKPRPTPEDDMPTAQEIAKALLDAPLIEDPKSPWHIPVRAAIAGISGKLDIQKQLDKTEELRDDQAIAATRGDIAEIRSLITQALTKEQA